MVPKQIGAQYTIDGLFQRKQHIKQRYKSNASNNSGQRNTIDSLIISDEDDHHHNTGIESESDYNDLPALEVMTQHSTTVQQPIGLIVSNSNNVIRVKNEPTNTNTTKPYVPPIRKSLTDTLIQQSSHPHNSNKPVQEVPYNGSVLIRDLTSLHRSNRVDVTHQCNCLPHMNHTHNHCNCDQNANNSSQLDRLLEPVVQSEHQINTIQPQSHIQTNHVADIDDIPISAAYQSNNAFRIKFDPESFESSTENHNNSISNNNIQQYNTSTNVQNYVSLDQPMPAPQFQLFPLTRNVKLESAIKTESPTTNQSNNNTINNNISFNATVAVKPPAPPPVSAPANEWVCTTCTYHNPLNASACEMCQSSRPLLTPSKNATLNQPKTIQQKQQEQLNININQYNDDYINHVGESVQSNNSHTHSSSTTQPYQFVRLSELRQSGQLSYDPAQFLPNNGQQHKSRRTHSSNETSRQPTNLLSSNNNRSFDSTISSSSVISSLPVRPPDTNNPIHYQSISNSATNTNNNKARATKSTRTTTSSAGHWENTGSRRIFITNTGAKLSGRLAYIVANKHKFGDKKNKLSTTGMKRKKSKQTKLIKAKRAKKTNNSRAASNVMDGDDDINRFNGSDDEWQPDNQHNNNQYDDGDDDEDEAEFN